MISRFNGGRHRFLYKLKSMKISSIICLVTLGAILGCKELGLTDPYRDLGSFNSRVEAQNQAITHILEKYNSMPTDQYYKVKYDNKNAPPSEFRQNALWYNKRDETLKLELDVYSGPSCTWDKVTRDVLEQASKSNDSMLKIDSLTRPNQPTSRCLQ